MLKNTTQLLYILCQYIYQERNEQNWLSCVPYTIAA